MINYLDVAFFFLVCLHALGGFWRGISLEVVNLLHIVMALLVATVLHVVILPQILLELSGQYFSPGTVYAVSLVLTFALSWIVFKFVFSTLLLLTKTTDRKDPAQRILGTLAGAVKGVALVLLLVMVAEYTTIPRYAFWNESWVVPKSLPIARKMREVLTYADSVVREQIENMLQRNALPTQQ